LYREIEHKSDISYEIIAKNIEEVFEDMISIIQENIDVVGIEDTVIEQKNNLHRDLEKCYNITNENISEFNEDVLFDTINDIISIVDRGYYPFSTNRNCVGFCRMRIYTKLKALTYHDLKIEYHDNQIYVRMVFDV